MSFCALRPCAPACAANPHAAAQSRTRTTFDALDIRFIPASGKVNEGDHVGDFKPAAAHADHIIYTR
jgi:hypothetical protein